MLTKFSNFEFVWGIQLSIIWKMLFRNSFMPKNLYRCSKVTIEEKLRSFLRWNNILIRLLQGVFLVLSKVILFQKGHLLPKMLKWGSHLFSLERPFRDLVLKKFYNHSVFIHLWRFLRLILVKICRLHWKLRIKQTPELFCKYLRNFMWWSITILWA